MQRDDRAYLWDIIDACLAIESVLADVEPDAYIASRFLRSAVEREFITIGEATAALSRAAPALFSRLTDGRRIVDFRNQLTHEYRHTDDLVVWLVAHNEVPVLRRECEVLLAEVGDADQQADQADSPWRRRPHEGPARSQLVRGALAAPTPRVAADASSPFTYNAERYIMAA